MAPSPRLSGRFDLDDPAGPRCAWSGSAIAARFSGAAVAVRLRGAGDWFAVTLDGAELPPLALTPAQEGYPVALGLPPGEHDLVLTKRTEPLVGEAQLLGFDLAPGGRLLPPPPAPARRLEFVGDSITAGFGVLGRDASCPFSADTEDFTRTYAALTARALGAEPVAVAWSGRGVCRNYGDEPGDPMPALYERTLPARAESRWDFTRFTPDAVVLNLGTNDFSVGRAPPAAAFVAAYGGLVRRIRAAYDRAPVVCTLGPMLSPGELATARAHVAAAVDGLADVHLLEHPPQDPADGFGCDGHPSVTTHRRMAARLTALLRTALGW
ncbi:MAG TPA: SGNH/GDSL hydrolase family protein [Polyangia bacterium]